MNEFHGRPAGKVKVRLIGDFLTSGIITKSEPNYVFDSKEDEETFLCVMTKVFSTMMKYIEHTNDSGSQHIDANPSDELIDELKGLLTNFDPLLGRMKAMDLNKMIEFAISCNKFISSNAMRWCPHGLIVLITQLQMHISFVKHFCNKNSQKFLDESIKHADRYFLSLAIAGKDARLVYDAKDVKIPVADSCIFQSFGDPEFDLYQFFTRGPPSIFYDSIHMLDEMNICMKKLYENEYSQFSTAILESSLSLPNRIKTYSVRLLHIIRMINEIPNHISESSKNKLLEKNLRGSMLPIVAFTRRV